MRGDWKNALVVVVRLEGLGAVYFYSTTERGDDMC